MSRSIPRFCGLLCLFASLLTIPLARAQDETENTVFSGPQVGEKLPPLKVQGVFSSDEGDEFDITDKIGDKPIALFFVHKRTRPAFGMTNALVRFAVGREDLEAAVVYLSDDNVEATKWMNQVKRLFPEGAHYGVAIEGQDGPGAYGLNRNVELTILVAAKDEVKANFALRQPSMQVDGPNVVKAMVEASGGGEVPDISKLMPSMRRGAAARGETDPKLGALVRGVIRKDADPADVVAAVKQVEAYVSENEKARAQLGAIASRIVGSGKLENYGSSEAQEQIRQWAKEYGEKPEMKDEAARKERK